MITDKHNRHYFFSVKEHKEFNSGLLIILFFVVCHPFINCVGILHSEIKVFINERPRR